MPEFRGFPKVPRLANIKMVVTEKLDGTNACVVVDEDGNVSAQSRKRVIVPGDDNYGFAGWVHANADELRTLGTGYHFGEWWGQGIQRNYGLKEKRFSLFNVYRYHESRGDEADPLPTCCHLVPLLGQGELDIGWINARLRLLQKHGSEAVPGFMNPEGLMVYLSPINQYIKVPIDPLPKGDSG